MKKEYTKIRQFYAWVGFVTLILTIALLVCGVVDWYKNKDRSIIPKVFINKNLA